MATKRMFSTNIVNSDAFLDMPPSTQALYFQLGMRADDDGFVNPKMVIRMMGSTDDEIKVLLGKRFLIPFESGVVVVKHHRINNNWDSYNCKRTAYVDEFSQLYIKENRAYTLDKTQGKSVQSENSLKTVFRIEENRIDNTTTLLNTKDVGSKKKLKTKPMTWKQYKEPEIQLDEEIREIREIREEDTKLKGWDKKAQKEWADNLSKSLYGKILMEYIIVKEMNLPTKMSAVGIQRRFTKTAKQIAEEYPDFEIVKKALSHLKKNSKPEMWTLETLLKTIPIIHKL